MTVTIGKTGYLFFTLAMVVSMIFSTSCSTTQKKTTKSVNAKTMTLDTKGITGCQVVNKDSRMKNGKVVGQDLYLRCSIQDYYIKFCESAVKREDVEKYLNRGIKVRMEIREGEWDNCGQSEYPVQSRVGTYAVILEIVE